MRHNVWNSISQKRATEIIVESSTSNYLKWKEYPAMHGYALTTAPTEAKRLIKKEYVAMSGGNKSTILYVNR